MQQQQHTTTTYSGFRRDGDIQHGRFDGQGRARGARRRREIQKGDKPGARHGLSHHVFQGGVQLFGELSKDGHDKVQSQATRRAAQAVVVLVAGKGC